MKPSLSLRLERRQIMTFALHQSLRVLQMPQCELSEWLQSEIERNPFLEKKERPLALSRSVSIDPSIPTHPSLRDHLLSQARESFSSPSDLEIAAHLIDHLDRRGWLTDSLEELPFSSKDSLRVLLKIQTFDPPGIGARNLQESLLIQLRKQSPSLAEILIRDHFQDLLAGRFTKIIKGLSISQKDLQQAIDRIAHLSMHAGSAFDSSENRPLVADLTLKEIDNGWLLAVGEEELPLFEIRKDYLDVYRELEKGEEKETMRSWLTNARWLERSLKRRRETLRLIGHLLIKRERLFFENRGAIVPIAIKELAELLQTHETTAWRAVTNKTLACPRGLVPLQEFFSTSTVTHAAHALLLSLIQEEDKQNPYTDEELAKKFGEQKIVCARRTIAKYRRLLNIGKASQRKMLCQ